MGLKFKILVKFYAVLYCIFNSLAFSQCDFQPGNPSGGTETVCFYDEFDNLLGCSYNCQVTGQQIKCGYKAGDEPWPDYFKVRFTSLVCFSPTVAAPLPVKLSSYSVERISKGNLIEWTTASEHNSLKFELQKSEDGIVFETIATIAGAGESQIEVKYKFIDSDIRSSMSYYRLKQIDFDGEFQYFQTLAMEYVPESRLEFVNYDNQYFKIFTKRNVAEVILISIDGKQQKVDIQDNLIKKEWFSDSFSILHVIYEDNSVDFKRMVLVNN